MNRLDDIRRVIEEFDWERYFPVEEIGTALSWNTDWSRDLAQAIANELDLPTCDCPGSGHVYPCHDWAPAYGE